MQYTLLFLGEDKSPALSKMHIRDILSNPHMVCDVFIQKSCHLLNYIETTVKPRALSPGLFPLSLM